MPLYSIMLDLKMLPGIFKFRKKTLLLTKMSQIKFKGSVKNKKLTKFKLKQKISPKTKEC